MARELIVAAGHDETITALTTVIGRKGAASLEVSYDRADGPPLQPDEEADLDEAIAWTATATLRDGRTLTGIHVVPPLGCQGCGSVRALIDLVEQLGGVNVVLVDRP